MSLFPPLNPPAYRLMMMMTRAAPCCQVSKEAALCLKYNFLANCALDRNEVTTAIEYYDKAIATDYVDQQGVLLVRDTWLQLVAMIVVLPG